MARALGLARMAQSTFNEYDCTDDGWGASGPATTGPSRNEISDANDSNSNGQSFNEGCQAYVEAQQPLPDDEDDPE